MESWRSDVSGWGGGSQNHRDAPDSRLKTTQHTQWDEVLPTSPLSSWEPLCVSDIWGCIFSRCLSGSHPAYKIKLWSYCTNLDHSTLQLTGQHPATTHSPEVTQEMQCVLCWYSGHFLTADQFKYCRWGAAAVGWSAAGDRLYTFSDRWPTALTFSVHSLMLCAASLHRAAHRMTEKGWSLPDFLIQTTIVCCGICKY